MLNQRDETKIKGMGKGKCVNISEVSSTLNYLLFFLNLDPKEIILKYGMVGPPALFSCSELCYLSGLFCDSI